jgi:hypothetical protein
MKIDNRGSILMHFRVQCAATACQNFALNQGTRSAARKVFVNEGWRFLPKFGGWCCPLHSGVQEIKE